MIWDGKKELRENEKQSRVPREVWSFVGITCVWIIYSPHIGKTHEYVIVAKQT